MQEGETLKEDTKVSQALGCHFFARNTNVLMVSVEQSAEKALTTSLETIAASLSEPLAVSHNAQGYEMQC